VTRGLTGNALAYTKLHQRPPPHRIKYTYSLGVGHVKHLLKSAPREQPLYLLVERRDTGETTMVKVYNRSNAGFLTAHAT
jgi:hypothetical protein